MVGTSGMAGERLSVVTASASTVPADVRRLHRHAVDHHGDAAGEQVRHCRDRAAIGHVHHVDAGLLPEQLGGEMHRGARPRRREAVLAGFALQQRDEVLQVLHGSVGEATITGAKRVMIETGARSRIQS